MYKNITINILPFYVLLVASFFIKVFSVGTLHSLSKLVSDENLGKTGALILLYSSVMRIITDHDITFFLNRSILTHHQKLYLCLSIRSYLQRYI